MENVDIEEITTTSESQVFDDVEEDDVDVFEKYENRDLVHACKMYLRLLRKKFSAYMREKMSKNFRNILYVTVDCPDYTPNSERLDSPAEYINEMRKQYPDNDIRLLIPILNLSSGFKPTKKISIEVNKRFFEFEKTGINFDFFAENEKQEAILYKLTKDNSNLDVYALYSPAFSSLKNSSELMEFEHLAVYMKAVRLAIYDLKKINFEPELIHSDKIPFYLGAEFENKAFPKVKVLQIVDDFLTQDNYKQEPFWTAINLADKKAMKRLCKDSEIKKCFLKLFNLKLQNFESSTIDCLNLIYKNYKSYKAYTRENEDGNGDEIFARLNERTKKMFPNLFEKGCKYYYPILNSLKKADYWAIISKTYYKEIFDDFNAPKEITKQLIQTVDNSSYVSLGFSTERFPREEGTLIYNNFNNDNFRRERVKNKSILIKELSEDTIKTNFIDQSLFTSKDVNIYGYLDSFYEAPLLLALPEPDVFTEGVDIMFHSILKLFEINKNIQVIISVENGMKIDYIKNVINFLRENSAFDGRWVFIETVNTKKCYNSAGTTMNIRHCLNLPKFFAGADMLLVPQRKNSVSAIHLLGMNYGCVPIVAKTGFLNDTVVDIFDDIYHGNGFKTKNSLLREPSDSADYYNTLIRALDLYRDNHSSWNSLIKNCIKHNPSWTFRKLERYNNIYKELL